MILQVVDHSLHICLWKKNIGFVIFVLAWAFSTDKEFCGLLLGY